MTHKIILFLNENFQRITKSSNKIHFPKATITRKSIHIEISNKCTTFIGKIEEIIEYTK